jgi:LysR family carnitine catabolism transcriptional activator
VQEPNSTAGVGAMVREGACELGLARLPLPREDLRAHELGRQELLFVLPPDTPMPHAGALAAGTLRDIPLVVSPPGTSTRMLLEQALEAVHVTPRIAVEMDAREAIVPLVLAGAGAALLPAPLAHEAGRRGAIVRAARPRIVRRFGLVHRGGRLSPAARAFLAVATG